MHLGDKQDVRGMWILLADARNAFNDINRTVMLWVLRNEWPSGARFRFNCYQHHAL